MTLYVHTRAGGFKTWVCVEKVKTKKEALAVVEKVKQYDDPMWREAEYLISDSLKPLATETSNVRKEDSP